MKTVSERIKLLKDLDKLSPSDQTLILDKALHDQSPTVRGFAIELVGDKKKAIMLPIVKKALHDRSAEVRMLAVECFSRLGENEFPTALITELLLNDKDELVRTEAAEALAGVSDSSVLDALYKALNDESPLVRSFAAETIGSIGKKKSIAVLEKCLKKERSERAQIGFYVGLSRLDGRNVLNNFIGLFKNNNYQVRSAVINSLDHIYLKGIGRAKIKSFLSSALEEEKTRAVRSSIERVLRKFLK